MKAEIICRHCNVADIYEVKRSKYGAAYMDNKTKLSEKQLKFLGWWYSEPIIREKEWTKEQLVRMGPASLGGAIARISEFKRLHLVENRRTDIDGKRSLFKLNMENARKVIELGGNLSVLRTSPVEVAAT